MRFLLQPWKLWLTSCLWNKGHWVAVCSKGTLEATLGVGETDLTCLFLGWGPGLRVPRNTQWQLLSTLRAETSRVVGLDGACAHPILAHVLRMGNEALWSTSACGLCSGNGYHELMRPETNRKGPRDLQVPLKMLEHLTWAWNIIRGCPQTSVNKALPPCYLQNTELMC